MLEGRTVAVLAILTLVLAASAQYGFALTTCAAVLTTLIGFAVWRSWPLPLPPPVETPEREDEKAADEKWLRDQIPQFLRREERARKLLTETRRSFSARDATRFWDSMVKVVNELGDGAYRMREVGWRIYPYWPRLPVAVLELPGMEDIFEELVRIVTLAENDAQFTANLNQRKDRDFLVSEQGTVASRVEILAWVYGDHIRAFREYPQRLERLQKAREISQIADPEEIIAAMGGRPL